MYSSVLASSVIVIVAVSGLLPPLSISALGLRFYIPELLPDALFFRRFLLGLGFAFATRFLLPCGQLTVILYAYRQNR